MQRALRDEDSAAPEGCRGLGDRHRAKAGDLADKPEAVQKAPRLDRPSGADQAVNRRQVLGQRAEVGIVTGIPRQLRPLHDGLQATAIVASQRELVEELAHGVAEVLASADPPGDAREGLGKALASGRLAASQSERVVSASAMPRMVGAWVKLGGARGEGDLAGRLHAYIWGEGELGELLEQTL